MTGRVEAAEPAHAVLPRAAGARAAFSSREEGNVSLVVGAGDAARARSALLDLVGLDPSDGVFMEQVHGAGVAVVSAADRGRGLTDHSAAVPGVDALVTTDPDLGLVVMVADCVPVLLAVPERGVAAVHAGRAGVAAGVVGAAVAVLAEEAAAAPRDVLAAVGPAIGGCCYEVPAELAVELAAVVPGVRGRTSWGTPSIDLATAVLTQLRAVGVEHVEHVDRCTLCGADELFSHRATTSTDAAEGRQAGVIRLERADGRHPAGSDVSGLTIDIPAVAPAPHGRTPSLHSP